MIEKIKKIFIVISEIYEWIIILSSIYLLFLFLLLTFNKFISLGLDVVLLIFISSLLYLIGKWVYKLLTKLLAPFLNYFRTLINLDSVRKILDSLKKIIDFVIIFIFIGLVFYGYILEQRKITTNCNRACVRRFIGVNKWWVYQNPKNPDFSLVFPTQEECLNWCIENINKQ